MKRQYLNYIIGAFIFLCAAFYMPGQNFMDSQHLFFRIGAVLLFALCLFFKPIRSLKDIYINSFLVLTILSFAFNTDSRMVAIASVVDITLVVMVFYILLNQLEDTNVIYSSIVTIIVINMIMVILQIFKIDPLCFNDVGQQNTHIVGMFGHPMNLSAYMSIVLPYVWHKNKWFGGMALILVFAPGGLDLASKSWAGILCAIIGMSTYFWFKNRRITVIVLATLLVVGSILTTVLYLKLPEGKREVVNRKVTLRLQTQYPLVRVAVSRPYFGHGPGTFQYIIPQVPELEFTLPTAVTGKPSMGGLDVTWNDFLGCALEIGIFSLLIFFGIIRKVFRQFRHDKSTETVALFASLATIPIGAFFHSYMNYFNVGMICLALYAMWNIKTERVENEN